MGGRGVRIKIERKEKNISAPTVKVMAMSASAPVISTTIDTPNQEKVSNKKSRKKYLKNIKYRHVADVSDEIANAYFNQTGKTIDKKILRTSDRDAHVITHHSKEELKAIKKNRATILSDPDIVLYNKRDGGSLVYGKKINGKDYVIAVRTGGNPNKQVHTYEATGFMLEKKIEDRYKKLPVLYKK